MKRVNSAESTSSALYAPGIKRVLWRAQSISQLYISLRNFTHRASYTVMPRAGRPPKASSTHTPGYDRFQVAQVARNFVDPNVQPTFGTTSFVLEDYNHSTSSSVPERRRTYSCHHTETSVTAFQTSVKTKLSTSSSGKSKIIFASPSDFIQIVEHVRCHGGKRSSSTWSCPLDGCRKSLSNNRSFDILRHFLIHIPDQFQPYKCRLPREICQITAVQENNFLCHMRTHGLEEKARCNYWLSCGLPCSYTTNDNGELSKHRNGVAHCDYPDWINDYYRDKNKESSRKTRDRKQAAARTKGRGKDRMKMEVETETEKKRPLPLPPGYTWEVPGLSQIREPSKADNIKVLGDTRATQTYEEDLLFATEMSSATGHNPLVIVLTPRPTVMLTEHDSSEASTPSGGKVSFGCQADPLEELDKGLPIIRGRPDPRDKLSDVDRSLMLVEQFLVEEAKRMRLEADGDKKRSPVSDRSSITSHCDSGTDASTGTVEDETMAQVDDDLMGADTDARDAVKGAELFTDMDVDSDSDSRMDLPVNELKLTVRVPAEPLMSRSDIDTADSHPVYQREPQGNNATEPEVSDLRPRYTLRPLPTLPGLANERSVPSLPRTLTPLPLDRMLLPSTINTVAPRSFVHIPTPPWITREPPSPSISLVSAPILLDEGSPGSTPSTAACTIPRAPTPSWLSRHSSTLSPSPLPTPSPLAETSPLVVSDSSVWSETSPFIRNLPLLTLPGSSSSLPAVLFSTRYIVSPSPQVTAEQIPVKQPSCPPPACELTGQRQWDPSRILPPVWLSSSNLESSRSPSPDM